MAGRSYAREGLSLTTFALVVLIPVVFFCVVAPINWTYLYFTHQWPADNTASSTAIGYATVLAIDAIGGYAIWWIFEIRRRLKAKIAADTAVRDARIAAEIAVLRSQPLQPISVQGVVMRRQEHAYAAYSGALREFHTTGFVGGSSGMSVRVAKGVTLRTSGTRSHAVKKMMTVSTGVLAITSQRVVFAGNEKSFDIPYTKLTNFQDAGDGLIFNAGSSSHHVQLMINAADRLKASVLIERLIAEFNTAVAH